MTRLPTPTLRGFATVLMAFGLITTGVGAGVLGPGAQDTLDDVSPVQSAQACGGLCVGTVIVIATGATAAAGIVANQYLGTGDNGYTREEVKKIKSLENQQQQLDLHALALGAHESAQQYRTSVQNFLADSRTIASQKAKYAALKLLNNGTHNATKLTNRMHAAIKEYYAVRERNLLAKYNAHIAQLGYIGNTAYNDSGIPNGMLSFGWSGSNYDSYMKSTTGSVTVTDSYTTTTTLLNGSTVPLRGLNVSIFAQYTNDYEAMNTRTPATVSLEDTQASGYASGSAFKVTTRPYANVAAVHGANESLSAPQKRVLNFTKYQSLRSDIEAAVAQLKANYNTDFAQTLISGWRDGRINASDVVTPEMLAQQYATAYNQTGASIYQWATLATMGLDSPDLENTSYLTVSYLKPTDIRYVTLSASGNTSALGPYNVSVGGEPVGQIVTANGTTRTIQVPIPRDVNTSKLGNQPPTVTIETYDGFSTAWSSDEVDVGETTTLQNVTITAESAQRWKRVTESGMLFARNAPNGTWTTNTTYKTSEIPGTEFFAPAGKYTQITKLGGEFTIKQIVTDSGSVSSLDTRDYNYQTSNASDFVEDLRELEKVREDAESRLPTAGGGGGGGLGTTQLGMGLLVLAGALLALDRRED
ncbi:hypothetical protein [Salarchaeum sp. JOR-1]|uniref:hypothetical protein n=1 Tax=Salarchaeum sp. JOR-1 TaxID=2599399 RepID=UPI00119882B5|nr:hypothetical protein [Salarchaeum sp. JOR-1]QDX39847.1 hypothetical protein FQU85_02635 [Salarchaeum sp. JOR-1]